jgi:hypothetical protein
MTPRRRSTRAFDDWLPVHHRSLRPRCARMPPSPAREAPLRTGAASPPRWLDLRWAAACSSSGRRGKPLWLIGERRADDHEQCHTSNLPATAALRELARAVKARCACEQAHQQRREEVGLDHCAPLAAMRADLRAAMLPEPRRQSRDAHDDERTCQSSQSFRCLSFRRYWIGGAAALRITGRRSLDSTATPYAGFTATGLTGHCRPGGPSQSGTVCHRGQA